MLPSLIAAVLAVLAGGILTVFLQRRRATPAPMPAGVERKVEELLHDKMAKKGEETRNAEHQREKATASPSGENVSRATIATEGLSVHKSQIGELSEGLGNLTGAIQGNFEQLRNELSASLEGFKDQLDLYANQLRAESQKDHQHLEAITEAVEKWLMQFQEANSSQLEHIRQETESNSQRMRQEVMSSLKDLKDAILQSVAAVVALEKRHEQYQEVNSSQLDQMSQEAGSSYDKISASMERLQGQLELFSNQLREISQSNGQHLEGISQAVEKQLAQFQQANRSKLDEIMEQTGSNSQKLREEFVASLASVSDSVVTNLAKLETLQRSQFESFSKQFGKLIESNDSKLDALRAAFDDQLMQLREDNAKKLEEMKQTMDDHLAGTFETRLGNFFNRIGIRPANQGRDGSRGQPLEKP